MSGQGKLYQNSTTLVVCTVQTISVGAGFQVETFVKYINQGNVNFCNINELQCLLRTSLSTDCDTQTATV